MKIKYKIKGENSFKVFNDSMGVALNRKNILAARKVKYMSYLSISMLEILMSFLFLGLMLLLSFEYYCMMSVILVCVATLVCIFMVINCIYPLLFSTFFIARDNNELEINDNGISFYIDEDQCLMLGWTHIKALVIGKHSLNFITDDFYYFYLDRKYEKEVKKALEMYNDSLVIIK